MCGIVGYVGSGRRADPARGADRLEYRGYDSAGLAVLDDDRAVKVAQARRASCATSSDGAAEALRRHASASATPAGPPTARRPTSTPTRTPTPTGRIAVVHNGIIENAAALRARLEAGGVELRQRDRHRGARPPDRRRAPSADTARGRRAPGAAPASRAPTACRASTPTSPDRIVVARNGSPPIVIGIGDHEMFVASDVAALVRYTTPGRRTSTTARWPR